MCEHAFLDKIAREVGDSFYLFDEAAFRRNYLGLRGRLRQHWPGTDVAYALKANYMPALVACVADMQGQVEVVSRFEYDVARRFLLAERIIYNGPIKREADLRFALEAGSQVNLDSFAELESLARLAGELPRVRVGLRLNFPSSQLMSRFGFDVENGELDEALTHLEALPGVEVVALHCHATCRALGVEDPVRRIRRLCEVASRLLPTHPIETINIGGGLLGEMPASLRSQFSFPVPSLEEYADAIGEAFVHHRPSAVTRLVVEPGVSLVANTMCLAARVMEVRQRRDGWQALLDTSINAVNPTRSSVAPLLEAVSASRDEASQPQSLKLVGHTCMEHDVICKDFTAALQPGDFVLVKNRGAYSLNYTPPFIVPACGVVDLEGRVLKRADGEATILASYMQQLDVSQASQPASNNKENADHEHTFHLCR
ncbi:MULTISPECIES: alanine racemase [unclassified Halomonas]|uniref:alanine racemase n=1 Tax=unclassified Halomonas TaxID=2609666 RepID=UPI0028859EDB|nr:MULTISPECIES: alanine racemase [unclassified Halomonas]MDT0499429.1 alanine racemase [Halomonas sp. PAR7]MDT0510754.1 alanine racemase [Halomonas sp. LES1]MDT0591717.1 alanine racemase [Halomonas sp. PAR8]